MTHYLTIHLYYFLHIASILSIPYTNTNDTQASLQILIKGLASDKGQVMIAVYDAEDKYMDIEKSYFKKSVLIKNQAARISLPNIPSGRYAVVCFHDKNSNQKLDKNIFGVPKEGYGFSNDAKASFGPPKFDKSSFEVNKGTQSITINMVYW